ncbi:MAG TPA: hypothetical protein ACFYD2_04160 [Candidatus Avalokitesvara rifleensis]|nr:hypothetical protein [Candidatus Brocadiales bacterium]
MHKTSTLRQLGTRLRSGGKKLILQKEYSRDSVGELTEEIAS